MKHVKLLLVLSIVSLFAVWSMATIEIQTTTPRVNPNGTSEIVGTFSMIFSAPEFGDPANTSTEYYVLVRVQLSQGVRLMNIGGRTKAQIDPANWVNLALERNNGAPVFSMDPTAVRLIRFESGTAYDYFDLLFTKNMYVGWVLSISDRVRVTVGTPADVTPSSTFSNLPLYSQVDTRLCCNFAATTQDFQYDDFWRVGMVAFHCANSTGIPGPTYSVNFQPADPSLAQKGQPQQACNLTAYWPCETKNGGLCYPTSFPDNECQVPAVGTDCPSWTLQTPPTQCGTTGWVHTGVVDFTNNNWFAITESCPTGWLFAPFGEFDITLTATTPNLSVTFCTGFQPQVWIYGGGLNAPVPLTAGADFTTTTSSIHVVLPDTAWYNPAHTAAYCILVNLDQICYETCPLQTLPEDQSIPVYVGIDYTPPDFVCGVEPAPIQWKVADIYGCLPVEPEPESYYLVLYFPYFAPVNDPEINWFCGVAVTNYADEGTDGGIFYFWEEDGDEYTVQVPPLGGHEMFVSNLDQLVFERSAGNQDVTPADETMSGVLFMQVTTPEYWRNYESNNLLSGALAGIDAFVLMGDGNQAYGYTARAINTFAEFLHDPLTGRAPIWNKKAHK